MELTEHHRLQLRALAAQTGMSWEQALDASLSEYRSLIGVDPPEEAVETLDRVPAPASKRVAGLGLRLPATETSLIGS